VGLFYTAPEPTRGICSCQFIILAINHLAALLENSSWVIDSENDELTGEDELHLQDEMSHKYTDR